MDLTDALVIALHFESVEARSTIDKELLAQARMVLYNHITGLRLARIGAK